MFADLINPFLCFSLLLIFPLHSLTNSEPTDKIKIQYPEFQHLHVKEAIEVASRELPRNEEEEEDELSAENEISQGIKLKLLHRDRLSSFGEDFTSRLDGRINRDSRRVQGLIRQLTTGDVRGEIVSGVEQGSGEYFVRMGVGSPPRSQYMVVDTGSDVVWVQCQPCKKCYAQSDPLFDPSASASFAGVPCGSALCGRLEKAGCRSGRCGYEVSYGDGSYTEGTLAVETLTIGRTRVERVAIGCGHKNDGMFVGAAGMLGLGGGALSFLSQLGGGSGGEFGYCLASRVTGSGSSSGLLSFGRGSTPVGAAWVRLLRNPRAPSFYYVGLSGLAVGGVKLVQIPEDLFRLREGGEGGVVMDTGTAVTRLPAAAYEALRDEFARQTGDIPRADPVSIFDTCYDLLGFEKVRVPTVSFYFSDGPTTLTLPAGNFLIPVDGGGTFCFAFAPSHSGLSIIGNIQQEGIQISVDVANGFVGFGPGLC